MYEGDFKNIPSDSLIIPILVTCIATTSLMTSCVLARLILRIKGQGKCFVEDLFLVVGYVRIWESSPNSVLTLIDFHHCVYW